MTNFKGSNPVWLAIFFTLAAGISAVSTVGFVLAPARGANDITVGTLAGLMLGGVLAFFFAVVAIVSVFRALALHKEDQALGLPAGSVRALIALVLIFLFFLMSVFLYLNVSQTTENRLLRDLSQEALDGIDKTKIEFTIEREVVTSEPDADVEVTEKRFDVLIRADLETSVVAEDMARQLITTIGTLIVAIAAFYFGSGAVTDTRRDMLDQMRPQNTSGKSNPQEQSSAKNSES